MTMHEFLLAVTVMLGGIAVRYLVEILLLAWCRKYRHWYIRRRLGIRRIK